MKHKTVSTIAALLCSGGRRCLPPERTGNETEVGGYAEAAGIPEDGQLHGSL